MAPPLPQFVIIGTKVIKVNITTGKKFNLE